MTAIRAAFVMEQSLGHVTHGMNLRDFLSAQQEVVPTWLPIPFTVGGAGRALPLWRSNWSLRASWRARRALEGALGTSLHQAVLFHTQVVSLFSTGIMKRVPSIISLDATPINFDTVAQYYDHRPATDGWVDRQKYRLVREAFHAASALVSWSEWAKGSLTDDYGIEASKIHILAPGAAPAYFEIGRRRHAAGAEGDAAGGPVRLLFVGGDFRRKGGDLLLECMRGPLGRRCELHVVTKDDSVAPAHNVYVYRNVGPNSAELLSLFAGADIFVLPSRGECLAVVLMEATAAGLPVVTTDVGALGEAVLPGESGLLTPPGDGQALEKAVTTLVDDAQLRRRMGRAGLALAETKFDAHRNNSALLDLVTTVAQGGAACRRAA